MTNYKPEPYKKEKEWSRKKHNTYNANTVLRGKLRDGGGVSFLDAMGESLVPVMVARAVAALELGFMVGSLM